MSISTFRHEGAYLKRAFGGLPAVLLSVVTAVAAIAAMAVSFWPDDIGPEVRVALRYIGAAQQRTTSGIETINDSLAAERRDLKMLSDQLAVLATRLDTLQGGSPEILRNNAELAERLKATQAQMAEGNASVAEQLKALTQMVRDNGSAAEQLKASQEQIADAIAKVSEESVRPPIPLPMSRPVAIPKRRPLAPSQAGIQLHSF
jgi:septal ring factor EnvC (AmiA/AmiB activator)